jgi:hypothetical protein
MFVNGNPSSYGGSSKVWKIRPIVRDWSATFEIYDPMGRMLKSELEAILSYAGYMLGLGDERKFGYGRFEIKELKEMEEENAA